jgi:AcrR family transcriptional regulator
VSSRNATQTTAPPGASTDRPVPAGDARERILGTAYDLFSRYGVQAVGVDRIIAEANVAKMSLYRHFPSKEELVLAVLDRREQIWTKDWLEREVERRASKPEDRLLAIFDAFDEWFRREDFEGCLFVNSLLEGHDRTSSIGAESVLRLRNVHALVQRLAEDAGIPDPGAFARTWQLLMLGSIVSAGGGDLDAARNARAVGSLLLAREG